MTHGPTIIATKGECIYCGAKDTRLTDEHILPLALGGQHIIADASCGACAKITSRFERHVARGLWGDARISYGGPSRRKSKRPSHIELHDPGSSGRSVRLPYSEYPAAMAFYTMGRAGFLAGMPDSVDTSAMWQFSVINDDAKAREFEQRHGMKLTIKFRHVPQSFARLLAKIGYGQILTTLDPGDFRQICVPYILGEKENLSYIVGSEIQPPIPDTGQGYVLRTVAFGDETRLMLVAEVRLHASNHTPVYHVVVGEVVGHEKVATVWDKIGEVEFGNPHDTISADRSIGRVAHWMPTVWPLPFWTG